MTTQLKTTPWGEPQRTDLLGDGIVQVFTASHGGIHLDHAQQAKVTSLFPGFGPWYEEDEEIAVVALVFAECFSDAMVRAAATTARGAAKPWGEEEYWVQAAKRWEPVAAWLDSDAARHIRRRIEIYERANYGRWERGSLGSRSEGWLVQFTQIGSGLCCERMFKSYPRRDVYADSELDAETVKESATA